MKLDQHFSLGKNQSKCVWSKSFQGFKPDAYYYPTAGGNKVCTHPIYQSHTCLKRL